MWPEAGVPRRKVNRSPSKKTRWCVASTHRWRNESGISRMISQPRNYTASFGLQWNTYRKTQLDSYTKTTLSRDRARRCLGEECWAELHRCRLSDVLEVGCGAGRFTEILLSTGAFVTSVDLSSAVEANQTNFPQDAHHRILQADVCHLPFAPAQYDVVFCLGVVQHTPRPRRDDRKIIRTSETRRVASDRPLYIQPVLVHEICIPLSDGSSSSSTRRRAQVVPTSGGCLLSASQSCEGKSNRTTTPEPDIT